MHNLFFDIVSRPFTFDGFLGILLGPALAYAGYWVADSIKNQPHRSFRAVALLVVIFLYFIGYVAVHTQQNANTIEKLSDDVRKCNQEFFGAIKNRTELTDKADRLSDERDEAATAWLSALQNPPPDIIHRSFDDPVRQQWLRDLAKAYHDHIVEVQKERKETLAQRSANQVPEPSCGKY